MSGIVGSAGHIQISHIFPIALAIYIMFLFLGSCLQKLKKHVETSPKSQDSFESLIWVEHFPSFWISPLMTVQ